jgi:hypothetical protein
MRYTIAFIAKNQLRDIKLEGLLNPDFTMEEYIHENKYDYLLKVSNRGFLIWNCKYYNSKSIANSTKWKTTRGAKNALKEIMLEMQKDKKNISFRGGSGYRSDSEFWNGDYVPVVCNITEDWNKYINSLIDSEKRSHQKKIDTLTKKLSKD